MHSQVAKIITVGTGTGPMIVFKEVFSNIAPSVTGQKQSPTLKLTPMVECVAV